MPTPSKPTPLKPTPSNQKSSGCGCGNVPIGLILLLLGGGYWWLIPQGNFNRWVSEAQTTANTKVQELRAALPEPIAGLLPTVEPSPNLQPTPSIQPSLASDRPGVAATPQTDPPEPTATPRAGIMLPLLGNGNSSIASGSTNRTIRN